MNHGDTEKGIGKGLDKKTILVITGPTGSGKTETALRVGERIPAEIILLDLRLACPGLSILGAGPRPGPERIPQHRLRAPDGGEVDPFAAAVRVRELTQDISRREILPVWTSGPQLLLSAAMGSLKELPPPEPVLKARLQRISERRGPGVLHRILAKLDGDAAARFGPKDSPRIIRALELALRGSGVPAFPGDQAPGNVWDGWTFRVYALSPAASGIKERLRERLRKMVAQGALDEVRSLNRTLPTGHGARTAHGFPHLLKVLEGELDLQEAFEKSAADTAHYARRQKNFLRRLAGVRPLKDDEAEPRTAAEIILKDLRSRVAS